MNDFIESLDLDPTEAVETAVEEFQMQGLSLAGVDQSWPPGDRVQHPLSMAFATLREATALEPAVQSALTAIASAFTPTPVQIQAAMDHLTALAAKAPAPPPPTAAELAEDAEDAASAPVTAAAAPQAAKTLAPKISKLDASKHAVSDQVAVAANEFAVTHLLNVLERAGKEQDEATYLLSARALTAMLRVEYAFQTDMVREQGLERLLASWTAWQASGEGKNQGGVSPPVSLRGEQLLPIARAVAGCVAAAIEKHEDSKNVCFDIQFAHELLGWLRPGHLAANDVVSVQQVAASLGHLCSNDDPKAKGSRSFQNGMKLGKDARVHTPLVARLRLEMDQASATSTTTTTTTSTASSSSTSTIEATMLALMRACQRCAVNDEICGFFAEDGGVTLALEILQTHTAHPKRVAGACALLAQVAANDTVKADVTRGGYLDLFPTLVEAHGGIRVADDAEDRKDEDDADSDVDVGVRSGPSPGARALEPAVRLLGMLMLRNPDVARSAHEAGCLVATGQALIAFGDGYAALARQCCQAVRTAVVRDETIKRALAGRENLVVAIRSARMLHPQCKDVGAAALRDLGLEYHGDTEKTLEGNLDYYYAAL